MLPPVGGIGKPNGSVLHSCMEAIPHAQLAGPCWSLLLPIFPPFTLLRCPPACCFPCTQVPTFKQVSSNESLLGPPNISENLLPMRIQPLERTILSPGHLQQLLGCYKGSKYLLSVQPGESIPWWEWQVSNCT